MLPSIAALFAKLTELWHLLMLQLQLWFDAMRAWIAAHYLQLAMLIAGMGAAAVQAWRSRARLLWWWARMRVRAAPAAFRQLERVARARQFGRQASETVEDYLHRLGAAHAGLGIELRVLRRAFNAARYGDRRVTHEEEGILLQAFHKIGAVVIEAR